MLVEDNPRDLELTLTALEKCQIANDIVVARDGAEALISSISAVPTRHAIPVIPRSLLDLKLPKVDGLEVLEKVKRDENLRHVPIVMLTSSREEQDLVKVAANSASTPSSSSRSSLTSSSRRSRTSAFSGRFLNEPAAEAAPGGRQLIWPACCVFCCWKTATLMLN